MKNTTSIYNRRTWLNPKSSDSTASVVAYSGEVTDLDTGKKYPYKYLEIADCSNKIKLHKTSDDTDKDFINKLKVLRNELETFIAHLEGTIPDTHANKQDRDESEYDVIYRAKWCHKDEIDCCFRREFACPDWATRRCDVDNVIFVRKGGEE